jgi:hypothetical protein
MMADTTDTNVVRGMRFRCNFGEALVVDVSDTEIKLGLPRGLYRWVSRSDLQIDHIIDAPPPERPAVQRNVFDAVRSALTDELALSAAQLSWIVATCTVPQGGDAPLALIGSAPIPKDVFAQLLTQRGFDVSPPSLETQLLVVGREDWSSNELKELLDLRVGESLRVYSQEMFLSWMISGCDLFQARNPEWIQELASDHPTLQFLRHWFAFDWPSTFISPSGPQADGSFVALEKGYLKHEGYKVGKHGLSTGRRHEILRHCYLRGRVPSSFPDSYIRNWGQPASSDRLRKIADSIASFCRNHKRLPNPSLDAVEEWEQDLAWLHESFYKGRYQFSWPETAVW